MIYNSCLIPTILSAQKNGHHLRNSYSFRAKKMVITYATAIPSAQKKWSSLTQQLFFLPKKMAITYATAIPSVPKKMAITYATAIPSVPKKMAITYATATLSAQKKWPSLSRQPFPLFRLSRISILLILIRVLISRILTFYPIPTLLLLLQLMIC
jgi:hypothetical protein